MSIREMLLSSSEFNLQNGVFYQNDFNYLRSFEPLYSKLRQKEDRNYSDDLVMDLPKISSGHPRYSEWIIRKKSLDNFTGYLNRRPYVKSILEIGCGNGWFSHQLAKSLPVEVCAVDINETELRQAANLFHSYQNLSFVYANVLSPHFDIFQFDLVIFPSSIQYFSNLKQLVGRLLDNLSPKGEIHIIDSPFYRSNSIMAAKERSRLYLQNLGCGDISSFYFYHSINELKEFKHKIIFNPFSLLNRMTRFLNYSTQPFYWIKIVK